MYYHFIYEAKQESLPLKGPACIHGWSRSSTTFRLNDFNLKVSITYNRIFVLDQRYTVKSRTKPLSSFSLCAHARNYKTSSATLFIFVFVSSLILVRFMTVRRPIFHSWIQRSLLLGTRLWFHKRFHNSSESPGDDSRHSRFRTLWFHEWFWLCWKNHHLWFSRTSVIITYDSGTIWFAWQNQRAILPMILKPVKIIYANSCAV